MTDRRDRRLARAAWAASIGLHALLFAGLWALVPPAPPPAAPVEPVRDLALALVEVDGPPKAVPVRLEPPAASPPEPVIPSPPAETAPPVPSPPVAPTPPTGRPPAVMPVPAALPAGVAAFLREHANRPATDSEEVRDVVDVQQAAAAATASPAEPEVVQAAAAPATAPNPAGGGEPGNGPASPAADAPGGGRPVHGPLPAGRTVVYALDCSGTMGLGGRLARAREALLATLALQPPGVRVLVVTYSGRAVPLTDGGPAEPTVEVRERVAAALARLEPAGESRHVEGVRVALKFDPDYVLILTDADDRELAGLRPVAAGARRPAAVSAARVTAAGVDPPRPLR